MQESSANPLIVVLLFLVRCLVPLALMLGASYLLRRLGLITEPSPPPNHQVNGSEASGSSLAKGGPRNG